MDTQPILSAVKLAGSQAKLAAQIQRSQQHVSFLCSGKYEPSAEDAIAIERATDGQIPRWMTRPDLWPQPSPAPKSERAA